MNQLVSLSLPARSALPAQVTVSGDRAGIRFLPLRRGSSKG